MPVASRYNDGHISRVRDVVIGVVDGNMLIVDPTTGETIDAWPAGDVFPVPGRKGELRIGCTDRPYGARLVVTGNDDVRQVRDLLPALAHKHRMETDKQLRIMGLATAALVSVIVAYVVGVPLLSTEIVRLVPPE